MKFIKYALLSLLALFLSACSMAGKTNLDKINDFAKSTPCVSCESTTAFEAKIRGLLYVSDVGFQCCADKRTLDPSVALKKVSIHSVIDLPEEKKILQTSSQNFYINEKFNAAFYVFLKQELEARGILVVDDTSSPYTIRLSLQFLDFSSRLDRVSLHSNLSARVQFKNINIDRFYTVRTRQEVKGFYDIKDISFYTFLLIKQLANKTASMISAL